MKRAKVYKPPSQHRDRRHFSEVVRSCDLHDGLRLARHPYQRHRVYKEEYEPSNCDHIAATDTDLAGAEAATGAAAGGGATRDARDGAGGSLDGSTTTSIFIGRSSGSGEGRRRQGESREHWSVGRSEYGRGKSRKDDEMRTSQSVEEQVQRCFQTKAAIVRTTLLKPPFSRSVMPMRRRPRSIQSERGIAEAVTQGRPERNLLQDPPLRYHHIPHFKTMLGSTGLVAGSPCKVSPLSLQQTSAAHEGDQTCEAVCRVRRCDDRISIRLRGGTAREMDRGEHDGNVAHAPTVSRLRDYERVEPIDER